LEDVTEICKTIVRAINLVNAVSKRSVSARGKADAGKFTVLHFADVFKGSELKKIVDLGNNPECL